VELPTIRDLIAKTTTVDFETHAIKSRPQYPPEPVGVAIRWPDGTCEYLRWGHPSGNNCTFAEAGRAIAAAWRGPVLFHNGKFDLEVAWRFFHTPWPRRWDDTLFLLFLYEAHAKTFALKPTCERLFKEKPDEQDALHDWILKNVPEATPKTAGAYISLAPGALVEPYAIGDVRRTHRLFEYLAPDILQTQEVPYDRERRLMPHLVNAEARGIRVNREQLTAWSRKLLGAVMACDVRIFKGIGYTFNLDSGAELADALDKAGLVKEWELTPTGKRSTAKDSLLRCCIDTELVQLLAYRSIGDTMLNTFIQPWFEASRLNGRLHTNWNQVRGVDGNGTRTGRIASDHPNLANVPNTSSVVVPPGLPALPVLRSALLPEEGCEWVAADYNSQELRIAAHYEDGPMLRAYQENPAIDQHFRAAELVTQYLGVEMTTEADKKLWRRRCKTTGFLNIYGGGPKKLAQQLNCSLPVATSIRDAYFIANPGLRGVIKAVSERARAYGFIRSLGGRLLKPEPADQTNDYLYKSFNKLVQGSAADQTKEAIIQFCEAGTDATLLVQVYDELGISAPIGSDAGKVLADTMINAMPCDTPMLVDVERGPSWGELQ
jgi:DNA polymerase-1